MFPGCFLDEPDHGRQFAARHSGIFQNGRRRDPGERGKGRAPRGGQFLRFRGGLRHAHAGRAVPLGDRRHFPSLLFHHGGMPIRLHEQHGLCIQRQPDVRVLLHAADGDPIQKLQRAGDDLRRDNFGDGLRRRIHPCKSREQRATRLRLRHELQQHLGNDARACLRSR